MNFKALNNTIGKIAKVGIVATLAVTAVAVAPAQANGNWTSDEYGRPICWQMTQDNGGTCALAPESVIGPGHVSSYTEFHESVVPTCRSGQVPADACRIIGAF